uniref:DUF4340 domain-containing protein n=1 Tax=Candidatus Electrothrix sp. TaxID=2170559 RepID=UPI004055B19E
MIRAIIFAAAALLLLQIGLTVAVHQQEASNLESTSPDSAFLSFAPDSITSVVIKGAEQKELVLQKNDKGWIMPNAFSAPASQHQVENLLQKLADARQGLAVATSKGAAKRFKTAEDNFERHVILKKGDAVAGDFYLGTSAGMRNSHARKTDQKAVVSIPVGSHEVDVDADSWLDRTLADLDKDELKSVVLDDIFLTRKAKKDEDKEEDKKEIWVLEGASTEDINQDAVDSLLNKITAISVQSVLDPVKSAELLKKEPAIQFTVTRQDDSTVSYAFAKNDEDDYFVLKMSDNDLYFKVGKWLVEDLTQAKREKLLNGYEEEKEPATPPVVQEAPQVEMPEQEAVEQAVLPELPPEDEEEAEEATLPVVQEEVEVNESSEAVQNTEDTTVQESPEALDSDDSAAQRSSSVMNDAVEQEEPEEAPAE